MTEKTDNLIDYTTTDILLDALKDSFYLVVDEFIKSSAELTTKLKQQAVEDIDDIDSLIALTHTLKGASGNVGAQSLSARCQTLESQLNAGEVDAIQNQIGEIDNICSQTRDEYLRVFKKAS